LEISGIRVPIDVRCNRSRVELFVPLGIFIAEGES
jgi:hypothetical protein